jgi:hypothetical protein
MAHGRKVVYLVGLALLEDAHKVGAIGKVAVVQNKAAVGKVRVLVQMVHAVGVEQRGPALDAMHLVALLEQHLRQQSAVLARDASDQRNLFPHIAPSQIVRLRRNPARPTRSCPCWARTLGSPSSRHDIYRVPAPKASSTCGGDGRSA